MPTETIEATASIVKGDEVLAKGIHVCISVTVQPPAGLEEWHGVTHMPMTQAFAFMEAGSCRIILADGRSGDLSATHVSGEYVDFQGSGMLR